MKEKDELGLDVFLLFLENEKKKNVNYDWKRKNKIQSSNQNRKPTTEKI